uniref:Uncharacterized protein n=1 Tax=Macaca fascicularis TaxID=9541 RepID=A0A7N9DEM0_MACFA
CWNLNLILITPKNYLHCLQFCSIEKNFSRVHVHNMQVCYICIHVPCWCAAPINSSFTLNSEYVSI